MPSASTVYEAVHAPFNSMRSDRHKPTEQAIIGLVAPTNPKSYGWAASAGWYIVSNHEKMVIPIKKKMSRNKGTPRLKGETFLLFIFISAFLRKCGQPYVELMSFSLYYLRQISSILYHSF